MVVSRIARVERLGMGWLRIAARVGIWAIALMVTFSSASRAQNTSGVIAGTVTDPTAASVPDAKITILHIDTGLSREVTTDAQGYYRVAELPLGKYSVKADASGFQVVEQKDLNLTVGAALVVNFKLTVASSAQQVLVTEGVALQVQTENATISYLVNENTMRDLPLNGRNYIQLATLQPGVVMNTIARTNITGGTNGGFSVAGQRTGDNVFLVDGTIQIDHASRPPGGVLGTALGVDAIREFRVLTGNYSAEYGTLAGGVINVVTRSGTNDFHGGLFYFFRNSALDAKNFLDLYGAKIPPYKLNQFGGTLGGPIVKNRVFFFLNDEYVRSIQGFTSQDLVLSNESRAGLAPVVVPNQPTTYTDVWGPTPSAYITSYVKPLINAMPPPNNGDNNDGTGNYIGTRLKNGHDNYSVARIDFQLSKTQSLFTRYTNDSSNETWNDNPPVFLQHGRGHNQFVTIGETSLIGAAAVNVATFGFSRTYSTCTDTTLYDFPYLFRSDPQFGARLGTYAVSSPAINIGSGGGYSCSEFEDGRVYAQNVMSFADKISVQKGLHSLTFGGNYYRFDYNTHFISGSAARGGVTFFTVRDMLIGQVDSYTQSVPGHYDPIRGVRSSQISTFIQDDFRIRPNLTLNLGLRWEMTTSPTESQGKISVFQPMDLDGWNPGFFTQNGPSPSNVLFHSYKRDIAPRFGFAWDPFKDGKTSIRGGASIFYQPWIANNWDYGAATVSNPPYIQSVTLNATSFPGIPLLLPHPYDSPGITIPASALSMGIYGQMKDPSRQYWSLSIQREIFPNTILEVSYSGSHGNHLLLKQNINTKAPIPCPSTNAANGFAEPSWNICFPIGAAPLQNPNFIGITKWENKGVSYYDGVTFSINHHLSHGLQFTANYTFSKSIDTGSSPWATQENWNSASTTQFFAGDQQADRSLSDQNQTHNFVGTVSWNVPSPKNSILRKPFGGWQVNSIVTRTSGFPWSVANGFDRTNELASVSGFSYPDLAPGKNCKDAVLGTATKYFDPTFFILQPKGQFGNVPRGCLPGPGLFNADFSTFKDISVTERIKLQFRAEIFNIFNHPNFGQIQNTILFTTSVTCDAGPQPTGSCVNAKPAGYGTGARVGNAGQVLTTANSSRQIQFALKLNF